MSTPGPVTSPSSSRSAASRRRSARCRRCTRSASTAAPARSTRSSGRTGPGSRRCSASRAASSRRTRARSRSAASGCPRASPPRPAARLGMAYQDYSQVLELSVAENLYLAGPPTLRPALQADGAWARRRSREFELDLPPTRPTGSLSLAERQLLEVVKALLEAEGAAARRADDRARARRGRAPARARARAGRGGRRRSSTSAIGCRRCSVSPIA